jgi:hypothetical protein
VSGLPKPDLLNTMGIGMLDHLEQWILEFMKTHERLDMYNAIWLSVPAYHDLTSKYMSHEEVSRWNGKEMKEMSRYLLAVVTQSRQGGNPAQRPIFTRAIQCIRTLIELYMYARYTSYEDATLSYMDDTLRSFHTFKDVFFLRRAGTKAKAKAKALRTELVKKRNVNKETNADCWMTPKKGREMSAWRNYSSHQIDISNQLDANYDSPKIHLMSHSAEQIL